MVLLFIYCKCLYTEGIWNAGGKAEGNFQKLALTITSKRDLAHSYMSHHACVFLFLTTFIKIACVEKSDCQAGWQISLHVGPYVSLLYIVLFNGGVFL